MVDNLDSLPCGNLSMSVQQPDTFYRCLADDSADAIVASDLERRIVFFNRAAQRLFGYRPDEVLGRPLEYLIPERFRERHPRQVSEFVEYGERARYMGDRQGHIFGLHADGTELLLGASIVRFDTGGQSFVAAFIRDVSSRIILLEQLAELANSDPLTGAANRRHFLVMAEQEHKRSLRHETMYAIVMFDLDRFKCINDAYGHDAGDSVLNEFVELSQSELRAIDTFARWGGEEFIALLPRTDIAGARKTAERIRNRTVAHSFPLPDGTCAKVTISIGIATNAERSDTLSTIIKKADDALYAAKQAGRNRTVP